MILSNAVQWLINHPDFTEALHQSGTNPEPCWQILSSIRFVDENQRMAIEIVFDFGNEGKSSKDLRAKLFYHTTSGFGIHSLERAWP